MGIQIILVIRKCRICQLDKRTDEYLQGVTKPIVPTNINELISIDYLGPLPKGLGNFQHILGGSRRLFEIGKVICGTTSYD